MFIRRKIIKGKAYAYAEERYRVGKKVKSKSRYLGPVETVFAAGALVGVSIHNAMKRGGNGVGKGRKDAGKGGKMRAPVADRSLADTLARSKAAERASWVRSMQPRSPEQAAREAEKRRELDDFNRRMDENLRQQGPQAKTPKQHYDKLREQNQAQINGYWQKVEEQNERDRQANETWKAERDASPNEPAPPSDQSPKDGRD